MMGDRPARQREACSISFGWTTTFPPITCCAPSTSFRRSRWVEAASCTVLQHDGRLFDFDPELTIRILLVGYCFGIARSGGYVKRCISIWPIGCSAGSAWTGRCRRSSTFSNWGTGRFREQRCGTFRDGGEPMYRGGVGWWCRDLRWMPA